MAVLTRLPIDLSSSRTYNPFYGCLIQFPISYR